MSDDSVRLFDPKTPVPISLPLHEALGICLMYHAHGQHNTYGEDGVDYTYSLAAGVIRLLAAMGLAADCPEWRDRAAALRAELDQIEAAF